MILIQKLCQDQFCLIVASIFICSYGKVMSAINGNAIKIKQQIAIVGGNEGNNIFTKSESLDKI